ncbi:class I SAM-dependent methyltransferase [Rheinheimera nanhaiensis]|uniref:class I SAM-dependent methyltransferase n=1 Tax=Rheinheimera nanhaiensis TaxID=1163621 RepID=UPI001ED9C339|nr:class I SAM-dependent methyltransferase [Rheinheimera nanhaiensis]
MLLAHATLEQAGYKQVSQDLVSYINQFPTHLGLKQLHGLLQAWYENATLSRTLFVHEHQFSGAKHALSMRDTHTKLVGLPVDVLNYAAKVAPQSGLWLEFGVCYGRSINILAKGCEKIVHGFDSFQGLPEDWKPGEPKGSYSTHGRLPKVAENVRLHQGWFEQSLPAFLVDHPEPVSLVHIDCDLYSSTVTVLSLLAERIVPGSVLIFDDFWAYEGFEHHEFKAFNEFANKQGLALQLISYAALGREVAFIVQ